MKIFVGIHSEAVGHFIRETEILDQSVRENHRPNQRSKFVLCTQKEIANNYFLFLLSDSYLICKWPIGRLIMRVLNRLSKYHKSQHDLYQDRDHNRVAILHTNQSSLLTPKREQEIRKHFEFHKEKLNLDKYYIFAVRDAGYDESTFRNFRPYEQEYRNTPLHFFASTFSFLESKGVSVLRVGRHNNSSIESFAANGIELANLECAEPDLCDFAMFYGAKKVYSTGTGVDDIGLFFRKKTYYLNIAPFGTVPRSPLIPAMLASDYYDKSGRRLNLAELVERNLHRIRPVDMIRDGEIYIRQKEADVILKFVSFVEEFDEYFDGREIVEKMVKLGWGEQWENVLY